MAKHFFTGPTSLELRRGEDWAWIGLASEDGLNRLRVELLDALDLLFIELRWSGVRRVALSDAGWMHGQGGNFCAGADLHEVSRLNARTADAFARRGQRVLEHLLWPGWRSLTLISGAAMGGGCDLALSGQERWGVELSGRGAFKLAHPAASHGILTGFGGTVRLVEVLGEAGAARLFQGLERWDSSQAMEAGAIQRKLKPEEARGAVEGFLAP
jgi:enoyl-CoA hydratase/carnithine racemase